MFGVILWSNSADRKAVIWCEDHGDLAYYEEKPCADAHVSGFFTAGDYVEFDVTIDDTLRRASNAINVADLERANHSNPDVDAASGFGLQSRPAQDQETTANIVTLSHHRRHIPEQSGAISHHG